MDLNLISSENYFKKYSSPQHALASETRKSGHIYRGLPAKATPSQRMGNPESVRESDARPRKQTKRETKGTDDSDKGHTRGRPRLDPQDQTAAEVCSLGMIFFNSTNL